MSEIIEREGVNYVRHIVEGELGWIYRDMGHADHGIDAQIELGDEAFKKYSAFGTLIGVQIKSGKSYLSSYSSDLVAFTVRNSRWIDYWKDYSIPVIIVIYSPEMRNALWVNAENYRYTKNGFFQYLIPKNSIFDKSARARLIVTSYSKKSHLVKMENIEAFEKLSYVMDDDGSGQPVANEIKKLLFDFQNISLLSKNSNPKSLFAVDTSLENIHPKVWFEDESYIKAINILLQATQDFGIKDKVYQIYSLNSENVKANTVNMLLKLLNIHQNYGIKVGFLRRDQIPIDIDRDFSIVNESFVLECNTKEWSKSVPQFSKTAVKFYLEVFKELQLKALWLEKVPKEFCKDALINYYS